MMRWLMTAQWFVYLLASTACASDSQSVDDVPPAGTVPVELRAVASGLTFPLYVTAPPEDSRLFIVEKGGRIRILDGGIVRATPFLDLTSHVSVGGEQGLLGLAFDPNYTANGRFVVHYTDTDGNTRLAAFTVSADPNIADPASERIILAVEQPFANHNGGQITFGPDGYLYLGLGDGGSSGDPGGRGQSLGDLLGGLLRLDVSSSEGYVIPPDNPFLDQTGARGEVWSYGLRNPWRFSFDRATGDLYIGDVGQGRWEEIDVGRAAGGAGRGVNYGWSRLEGAHCFSATPCDESGTTLPVKEYSHSSGCSVTGGYVYRGTAIPELQGHYFYADYCSGWVRSFQFDGDTIVDEADWPTLRPGGPIPSFGEDAAGELYVMSGGMVYRIVKR